MRIVVIGGTGLIGSRVVARLAEHGHEAIAASPDSGVNTVTGQGLVEVLARQNGPTVVAGHSYGGQIITALGTDTWRSRPTTWPWSPTQMRCCSSSRQPPRR